MQTEWRFHCHLCNAIKRKKRDMWSIATNLNWTLNKYYIQPSNMLICYITLDCDVRNIFIRDFTAELHQTYLPSYTENIRGLNHSRESISTPGPCQCESHKSGHSWIDPYLTQRFSKVSKGWAVKQELIRRKVISKSGEWWTCRTWMYLCITWSVWTIDIWFSKIIIGM